MARVAKVMSVREKLKMRSERGRRYERESMYETSGDMVQIVFVSNAVQNVI